jgi:hypothetical protein
MTTENTIQSTLLDRIELYCEEKGYQVKSTSDPIKIRLDISNLSERTIVNVFSTGTIQIQGKKNPLFLEMESLKTSIESSHHISPSSSIQEHKHCCAAYDIMLIDVREHIKHSWNSVSSVCELTNNPSPYIEYRTKISRDKSIITITQYSNGKLTLQGKTDYFFDYCCDHVEKIAQPSNKDIAARFVSTDQVALDAFVAKYTPDLIRYAEEDVRKHLDNSFLYLEPQDQKWFIASKCLCYCGITLPEYSPFVMPSSKAFEGFSKKLIIGIGLVPPDHFSQKTANFGILNDKKNADRIKVCAREKYVDTHLDKLRISLDEYRNFMMHSDDSFVTKVENLEKAKSKVNDIMKTQKELFDYFNKVFRLLP